MTSFRGMTYVITTAFWSKRFPLNFDNPIDRQSTIRQTLAIQLTADLASAQERGRIFSSSSLPLFGGEAIDGQLAFRRRARTKSFRQKASRRRAEA